MAVLQGSHVNTEAFSTIIGKYKKKRHNNREKGSFQRRHKEKNSRVQISAAALHKERP